MQTNNTKATNIGEDMLFAVILTIVFKKALPESRFMFANKKEPEKLITERHSKTIHCFLLLKMILSIFSLFRCQKIPKRKLKLLSHQVDVMKQKPTII